MFVIRFRAQWVNRRRNIPAEGIWQIPAYFRRDLQACHSLYCACKSREILSYMSISDTPTLPMPNLNIQFFCQFPYFIIHIVDVVLAFVLLSWYEDSFFFIIDVVSASTIATVVLLCDRKRPSIIRMASANRRLSARLQYCQCVSNGNTAVLH